MAEPELVAGGVTDGAPLRAVNRSDEIATTTLEPFFFGALFGVLSLPASGRVNHGVVVCAPFGHQNVCAYRPLRTLAGRLAESGLATLRFEWPGTGDSGEDRGPRPEAWLSAVERAVAELRSRSGVSSVTLLGLRAGGTLALAAAAAMPDIEQIVLLAPFVTGRSYLRELRAFHAMAQQTFEFAGGDRALPDGSLESSGFLIPAADVEAFERIEHEWNDLGSFNGKRLLVVTAQTDARVATLAAELRAAGAEVSDPVLPALARVWDGTSVSVLPPSCSRIVCDWLAHPSALSDGSSPSRAPLGGGRLVDGGVVDKPVLLDGRRGRIVGITSQPTEPGGSDTWIVFLNAGRVRRIGPNRFATTFARSWASAGVQSLRVDLVGVGDSDGRREDDETPVPYDAAWYYDPGFITDIEDVLAHLAKVHNAKRFVLIGLCSGATLAYKMAIADSRVIGVEMLNPRALSWDSGAAALRAWREATELILRPRRWRHVREARPSIREALKGVALTIRGRDGRAGKELLAGFATLAARNVALRTVFSSGDQGISYFEELIGVSYRSILERYGMEIDIVEGVDHTFRPLWAHEVLRRSLEAPLQRLDLLPKDGLALQRG